MAIAVIVIASWTLALVPDWPLAISAPKRILSPLAMGGFEQKKAPARAAGSRVSLVFSCGSAKLLQEAACSGGEGLTGIVYALPSGRIEVIAEGPHDNIDALVERVRAAAVAVHQGRRRPQLARWGELHPGPRGALDDRAG